MIPDAFIGPIAVVVSALVGGLVALIVRKVRGPVAVQDLWAENRSLRKDIADVETRLGAKIDNLQRGHDAQAKISRVMGDGFDALSSAVERMSPKPKFTPDEHRAIEAARALRDDDGLWSTVPHVGLA